MKEKGRISYEPGLFSLDKDCKTLADDIRALLREEETVREESRLRGGAIIKANNKIAELKERLLIALDIRGIVVYTTKTGYRKEHIELTVELAISNVVNDKNAEIADLKFAVNEFRMKMQGKEEEIVDLQKKLQVYKDYKQCAGSVISDLQERELR
jgi:hypothetical protein